MLVGHNDVRRQVIGGIYEIHLHGYLPHTHTRTHAQTDAGTHTYIMDVRTVRILILSYISKSFLPSFATLYLSIAPHCPSFNTFFPLKKKSGTQGRNNPHNKGAKRTRGERPGFIRTGKYPAINLLWLHRLCKRFKIFFHNIMYLISDIWKRIFNTRYKETQCTDHHQYKRNHIKYSLYIT